MDHTVTVVLRRDDGKQLSFESFPVGETTTVEDVSTNWLDLEEAIVTFGQQQ